MSNIKHLLILAAFAASTSSCTGLLTPERQAKLDAAAEKYEATTGITPAQTGGLLFKWFGDFNEAKAANELREASQPAPSAKDVRAVQAWHVAPPALLDAAPPGAQSPAARNHTSRVACLAASDRRCRGISGFASQALADPGEAKQSSLVAAPPSMTSTATASSAIRQPLSWSLASPAPALAAGRSDGLQAAASATPHRAPHSTAPRPDTTLSRSNPSPPAC